MRAELFAGLVTSIRQGGAILRGEMEPSRRFVVPNPNIKPVTRANVDAALLLLEHVDIPAANLVRNYLDGLESRVRTFELGADEEPGSWSYSWDTQGE